MSNKIEPLKISLARVVEITGESLSVVHNAIKAGHLTTFLVGRRRFARPKAVRAWVDHLEASSQAGTPVVYRPRKAERGDSNE